MKATVLRAFDWYMTLAVVVGLVFLTGVYGIPAESWIKVYSVTVVDGVAGKPVQVVADREIRRDFNGRYTVVIRRVSDLHPVCWSSADVHYKEQPRRKISVTLEWWGAGEPAPCAGKYMKPGAYLMTTCWTVKHPFGFLPNKETCIDSDVFRLAAEKQEGS